MQTFPTVNVRHGIYLLFWSQTHKSVAKRCGQQSFQLKEDKGREQGVRVSSSHALKGVQLGRSLCLELK